MKVLIGAAAVAAVLVLSPAYAVDFPAAPINHGAPTNLPGEDIIPGLREALVAVNGITQPILQPVLAPGGAVANDAAPTRPNIRRHRLHTVSKLRKHHRLVAHLHRQHAKTHRVG